MVSSPHLMANGDIRPSRFVKVSNASGQGRALESDANELVVGISMDGTNKAPIPDVASTNAAESGQHLRVHVNGEGCLLEAGTGGWTAGELLKSDADGKGVSIATTGTTEQLYGAIALETAAAGELGKVTVLLGRTRPALS